MGGKRSHEHTLLAPRSAGETIRQVGVGILGWHHREPAALVIAHSRCTLTMCAQVRSKFGLTTTQFGKLLGDTVRQCSQEARSSLGVKQLVELDPSGRIVTRWEEGLARVPLQAWAISKGLYDQRLREEEALPAAPHPAMVPVAQHRHHYPTS